MKTIGIVMASLRRLRFPARVAIPLIATLTITALTGCASPAPAPSPTATPPPSPSPIPPPVTTTPPPPATTPPPPTTSPAPPPRYTLNITVNPTGSGSTSPSSGTYDSGTQVSLQATPASACWAFDYWSGDVGSKVASTPLTMNGNKNITANFIKVKYSLSVTVTPPGSGSVGPNGGTYDCSQTVTLVAIPATGYDFDHWGGDTSGNSASTNITMQSDKNVTAYFKLLYQTIKRDMPAGSMALNTISFTSQLKARDRIQGFIELTGDYHPEDVTYTWSFSITGPQGVIVENWQGNILSTQHHDFDKTVQFDGIYFVKVSHVSRWPKSLTIQIKPGGWQ